MSDEDMLSPEIPKVMLNGQPVDLDDLLDHMDEEIRSVVNMADFNTPQDFLDAYCRAHLARFGEAFSVSVGKRA